MSRDEMPTLRELKLARDILIRASNADWERMCQFNRSGQHALAESLRYRVAQTDSAVDMLTDRIDYYAPSIFA